MIQRLVELEARAAVVYGNCVRLLAGFNSAHVFPGTALLWYRRLVGPMVLPGARMMTEEQVMQIHEGLRSWECNSCVFTPSLFCYPCVMCL